MEIRIADTDVRAAPARSRARARLKPRLGTATKAALLARLRAAPSREFTRAPPRAASLLSHPASAAQAAARQLPLKRHETPACGSAEPRVYSRGVPIGVPGGAVSG